MKSVIVPKQLSNAGSSSGNSSAWRTISDFFAFFARGIITEKNSEKSLNHVKLIRSKYFRREERLDETRIST